MKTIERLVEDQVRRWEEARRAAARRAAGKRRAAAPVVCISRQAGSGGTDIAKAVSEQLGVPLFDRELLTHIARRTNVLESVLSVVDQHGRSWIEESLGLLAGRVEMSSGDFLRELSRAVLAIGQQGGAVFLGRGTERILPPERRLAVRIVAPLDWRVAREAARPDAPPDPAAAVRERDEQRHRFVRDHFGADDEDASVYDLVLQASRFRVPAAASLIVSAHRALCRRLR